MPTASGKHSEEPYFSDMETEPQRPPRTRASPGDRRGGEPGEPHCGRARVSVPEGGRSSSSLIFVTPDCCLLIRPFSRADISFHTV
ncbi:Ankyrin Repeat Domain-Containing Protein 27 [Manis pentadactyla]|nr:Ankyrin Repeat Domain-Containing Protein 27 [Manis pentadactyla]